MKKILFYLNIVFAIFILNSLFAQNLSSEFGFKIANEYAIDDYKSSSQNLFLDVNLEDIFEDDSTDSEKSKSSSEKTAIYNTAFIAQKFSYNNLNKILPTKYFCPSWASHFIFICVLRL
jgi:uncharacterized membrane protein